MNSRARSFSEAFSADVLHRSTSGAPPLDVWRLLVLRIRCPPPKQVTPVYPRLIREGRSETPTAADGVQQGTASRSVPSVTRGRRSTRAARCLATRVWFYGWRVVFAVVLADGSPHRFDDGLPIRRVCCAACDVSRSLRPPFLYPHHTFEPDVSEAAALAYLSAPESTYASVAAGMGCSPRSVVPV